MQEIFENYKDYVDVLVSQSSNFENKYVICLPPDKLIAENCEIDPKFVQEHILEVLQTTV